MVNCILYAEVKYNILLSYPEFSLHLRLAAWTSFLIGERGVSVNVGSIEDGDSVTKTVNIEIK